MEEKDDYYKSMDDLLRKVTNKNLFEFNTSYTKDLKQFEIDWSSNYPANFKEGLELYKALLIAHILDIRDADAMNVFLAGFKNGIEFYQRLKTKYSEDDENDKEKKGD